MRHGVSSRRYLGICAPPKEVAAALHASPLGDRVHLRGGPGNYKVVCSPDFPRWTFQFDPEQCDRALARFAVGRTPTKAERIQGMIDSLEHKLSPGYAGGSRSGWRYRKQREGRLRQLERLRNKILPAAIAAEESGVS